MKRKDINKVRIFGRALDGPIKISYNSRGDRLYASRIAITDKNGKETIFIVHIPQELLEKFVECQKSGKNYEFFGRMVSAFEDNMFKNIVRLKTISSKIDSSPSLNTASFFFYGSLLKTPMVFSLAKNLYVAKFLLSSHHCYGKETFSAFYEMQSDEAPKFLQERKHIICSGDFKNITPHGVQADKENFLKPQITNLISPKLVSNEQFDLIKNFDTPTQVLEDLSKLSKE